MIETRTSYADKPWLKSYKLGPYRLAKSIDYPKVPVYHILDEAAAKYPSNVAILFQGRSLTYLDLKLHADRLATALADLGVEKGDRVAAILPNSPQMVISIFAIAKAGGVFLPITPMLTADQVEYQMVEAGVQVVICSDTFIDLVNEIQPNTDLKEVIVTSIKDYSPEEDPEIEDEPGMLSFRRLIAEYEPDPPEIELDPMEDLAMLCFTGGTTGVPKGVMHTHYSTLAQVISGLPWIFSPMEVGVRGKASMLLAMPLYHAGGITLLHAAIYWGLRCILIPDPRDVEPIIKEMKERRPFCLMATPTQLMRMVLRKVGRLQTMVVTGGATLPKGIADAWKKESGMPATQVSGLSEGGMTCNLSAFSKITGFVPFEKHSLGVPVPDLDAKVVDPETGDEVPFGEIGEMYFRGPSTMKGYWPTIGKGLEDGWVSTTDRGWMDEDGYFYLIDREKDMIHVAGYTVYSNEVDDLLFTHPAVAMAATVGVPDPNDSGNEKIKAFIQLKEGYESEVTPEDIISYCEAKLPAYAVPGVVEFREDLPLTAMEKIFKRALREEEIAKMQA